MIQLKNEEYELTDQLIGISIADSFVLPQNKIKGGNGEAKLYIGQNIPHIQNFIGGRGSVLNCVISKINLENYLEKAYSAYMEPSQDYRYRELLPDLWNQRKKRISDFPPFLEFKVKDQNQLEGPRIYINALESREDKIVYTFLREIPLPVISFINIYKLMPLSGSSSKEPLYYFCIFLKGTEDKIKFDIVDDEKQDSSNSIGRFIPVAEDTVDVETEIVEEESKWQSSDKQEKSPLQIKTPFDPDKIKVRTTPSTIGQVIDDLEDDIINLNTEFQRLPNLWNGEKKSRFIESLILKLPIPAFYFNEKEENDLEVVDGLQRISTIKKFVINQDFVLTDMEFLDKYNGCRFSDLPTTFQRRIKTFPITTYIIEKGTPDSVKYNIFKRVNTGGLMLTDQEIRHAINQGIPAELIADLARGEDDYNENNIIKIRVNHDKSRTELYATREGKAFVEATDNRIGTFRMADRDFITRFVSFYLTDYTEYEPSLDTFLNSGMAKIKDLDANRIKILKDDFYKSMKLAYDLFGNDAFRKRFDKSDARKPINKALFEVLSVCFSKLSVEKCNLLRSNRNIFIQDFIHLHHDNRFLRSITQGTAIKENVITRFSSIEKIINSALENK